MIKTQLVLINETNDDSVVLQAEVIDGIPEEKPQLICKYCRIEFDYENVLINSRLSEHMNSCESHKQRKLKAQKREEEGKQLTLGERRIG